MLSPERGRSRWLPGKTIIFPVVGSHSTRLILSPASSAARNNLVVSVFRNLFGPRIFLPGVFGRMPILPFARTLHAGKLHRQRPSHLLPHWRLLAKGP